MSTKTDAVVETTKGATGATKVSKRVVELLEDLTEWRAVLAEATDRVEELRNQIFAEVGKEPQTLTYYNAEVGRITRQEREGVDTKKLLADFAEVYDLVKKVSVSFPISTPTQRKTK